MARKLLGVVIIVIVVIFIWVAFQSASDEAGGGGVAGFLESDIFGDISSLTTEGLSLYQGGSDPALVTFEELGEFSPLAGMVEITREENIDFLDESDFVASEYLTLRAFSSNTQPVKITGWTLQSMVSDEQHVIPGGAYAYVSGEVNTPEDIFLLPGERAIISSAVSPIGVSFRTNLCTGYLGNVQDFEPLLDEECPFPVEVMPPTLENIRAYGDACIDFAAQFDQCRYLTSSTPGFSTLSSECVEFLQPKLTYTNCVEENKGDPAFLARAVWRIYLGSSTKIWKDRYEVIRLSDDNGQTVDALTY